MIITLTRTGGFTGIPLKKTIDTAKLPKAQAEKIEKLVVQETNETEETKKNKPDSFTYNISIQDQATTQSIKVGESSLSGAMEELIDYLKNLRLQ